MAKQTPPTPAKETLIFLTDQLFLKERVDNKVDVHPAAAVIAAFEKLAVSISPKQDFSWRGCQECINHVVKFVFDNIERLGTSIVDNKVVEIKAANGLKNDE